jgi:hypothetical protein
MAVAATEEEIARWWQRWPDANIGVVAGRVSGVVVLDVDPRNDGKESLRALEGRMGELPQTPEDRTGGGGRHLWFRCTGELPSAVLAPGLELKAEGSVVVAPPSVHLSGRPYTWAAGRSPRDREPAPLPAWIEAQALGEAHADPRHTLAASPPRTTQEQLEFAEAWARAGIRLRPRDRYYRCPFHDDHRPSLHVDSETCRWFCFGCRRGGGIGRLRQLLGDPPRPASRARLRGRVGEAGPVTIAGWEKTDVVGESLRQDALLALTGGRRAYGGVELDAVAELVPDPVEPRSVAVLIDGVTVGELRWEDVERLSLVMREARDTCGVATCRAMIRGGWDRGGGDVGLFGVVLFLP